MEWRRLQSVHIHMWGVLLPTSTTGDLVPSYVTITNNYMTELVWIYLTLKTGFFRSNEQIWFLQTFLEACIWLGTYCGAPVIKILESVQSVARSRGCDEALSLRRLVSFGKIIIISNGNKAKITNQIQSRYHYQAQCCWVVSNHYRKQFDGSLERVFNLVGGLMLAEAMSVCLPVCSQMTWFISTNKFSAASAAGQQRTFMLFPSFELYC